MEEINISSTSSQLLQGGQHIEVVNLQEVQLTYEDDQNTSVSEDGWNTGGGLQSLGSEKKTSWVTWPALVDSGADR